MESNKFAGFSSVSQETIREVVKPNPNLRLELGKTYHNQMLKRTIKINFNKYIFRYGDYNASVVYSNTGVSDSERDCMSQ